MFTTGSKLLLGGTALAVVLAIVYGIAQDGTLGVIGLLSAAAALGLVATIDVAVRDANAPGTDEAVVAASAAARAAPTANVWPLAVAAGAALIVLGLVTQPAFFLLGGVLIGLGGFQWMLDAWSQRASADAGYNAITRERLAGPLEFPVLAAIVAVLVIFSFSRIMLFLSKTGGPIAFGALAALILGAGFTFANLKSMRSGAIASITAIAALGLVAGGVAAGLDGERDTERHETTGDLREESACDTAEELHADENASQSVANKANVLAILTLDEEDVLSASLQGGRNEDQVTVGRGNASNVIFRNHSDEPRRLVLTTGTRQAVEEDGEEIEGETVPDQRCTALADDGGSQLLSFRIDKGSANADEPFQFSVPGVPDAAIEVVVP